MDFDWADLAFGSKKAINSLKATFIAAPRELSPARFTQLVKEYLPAGNIILGLAKEDYVDGFDGQPQFKTLSRRTVEPIIEKVARSASTHKIVTLTYFQRELQPILEKLKLKELVLVRGSWQHSFHTRPEYYTLVKNRIPYHMVSPFSDEHEAKEYELSMIKIFNKLLWPDDSVAYSETGMLELANRIARASYDYSFQTGAVLGERIGASDKGYRFLTQGFNKVVPFQTYAMHYGATREEYFSPPNDLNYYDTIHAEVKLVLNAQRGGINLGGTTVFINLLPCPTCSRMLAESDIDEVVYSIDHSDGYAVKMLEAAGKKVRRIVI